MAKALQCPACGTKRMADTLAGVDSFPCGTCGKVLKVPPSLAGPSGDAPPDAAAPAAPDQPRSNVVASSAAPGAVPPPPRRRGRTPAGPETPGVAAAASAAPPMPAPVAAVPMEPVPIEAVPSDAAPVEPMPADPLHTVPISAVPAAGAAAAGVASAAAGRRMVSSASPAATAAPPHSLDDDAPAPRTRTRARRRRAPDAGAAPDALPVVVRILIWVIALPIGLALVGIPARKAGYLSSQKLLDVVIHHNLDRFVPLAVIVLLWALVTAIVVHLLAEGGRVWRHQRRLARDAATRPRIVSSSPGVTPPPRRINGNANGSAAPQRQSRAASRGGS